MPGQVTIRILRRPGPQGDAYWEEFEIPRREKLTVHMCLQEIQRRPVNREGRKVDPVAWEASCLEESCGSCAMLVDGVPRLACATFLDDGCRELRLEPLSQFPVVRDLVVDRSALEDATKRLRAWIPVEGLERTAPRTRMSPRTQQLGYRLAPCMGCGCCMEACPQYSSRSAFIGPAPLSQIVLLDAHPSGQPGREERLERAMEVGGIQDCGRAQACEAACPKHIPLTDSLARLSRHATLHGLLGWLDR